MTAPLFNDLRKRVVDAIELGENSRSVAALWVAVSSAVKWYQRYIGQRARRRQARWADTASEDWIRTGRLSSSVSTRPRI